MLTSCHMMQFKGMKTLKLVIIDNWPYLEYVWYKLEIIVRNVYLFFSYKYLIE